ncbi:hypothetical protein LSTR_LSTR006408 [Laodelphax striatellus]|uniref:Dephospho-CoA kinase domain-containing protein n=1 Tax=Laodelphax striatellus TaxID=195883 RepID=A0A482WWL5_LAOST|nr:hypothetical protein LSTR_LSTR006408 [Laodelphax striatellus]
MFIVGLTGGIATGKSTVVDMIRKHGIPVVDADVIARKVVEPGRKAWHKIKKEFGDDVFLSSGELNRQALGDIIFDDVDKRRKLNQITHPEIYKEMMYATIRCFFQGHQFVVMDLPLLFESGYMLDYVYKIIVVTCEEDLQLQRLIERQSISESQAKKRIAAQMSLDTKCDKAHFVVENSGNLNDTQEQVDRIVSLLKASRHHWKLRIFTGLVCSGLVSLVVWLGTRYVLSQNKSESR